jgi:hypothetical protein
MSGYIGRVVFFVLTWLALLLELKILFYEIIFFCKYSCLSVNGFIFIKHIISKWINYKFVLAATTLLYGNIKVKLIFLTKSGQSKMQSWNNKFTNY